MYNTSYESKYSTGDRTKWIEQVYAKDVFNSATPLDNLIDGDYTSKNSYFIGSKASETKIVFKMKRALVIDGFTWHQSNDTTHGKWRFVRLDSSGSRLSLGEFTLGGSKKQKVEFNKNIGPSHTYILEGVSGTTSTGPYIHQIDFKAEHYAKILVQLNGKYGYFKGGEFIPLEKQREPTYEDYQSFGMPDYREFKKEEWEEKGDELKRVPWNEEEDGECFVGEINLNLPENKKVTSLGIGLTGCGFNGPGPQELIAGDCERGFYGEVDSSEIISGEDLAKLVGVTQGSLQNSDTPWLKWAYKGKTLFRPKKPIRYAISWDHLNSKDLVYGDRTIEVNGNQYKIRLMRGISEEYEHAEGGSWSKVCPNSEWNHLMLPIHERAKDASWARPDNVESDVPYWDIDYTDADLGIGSEISGRCQWCQEHYNSGSSTRVIRGCSYGVSYANYGSSSRSSSDMGWAPVLELLSD